MGREPHLETARLIALETIMTEGLVLDREAIGKRLKGLRNERCFTQKEMGDFLGIPWRRYQTYEVAVRLPTVAAALILAKRLSVNLDWLMTGSGTRHTVEQARELGIRISIATYLEMRDKNVVLSPNLFELIVRKANNKGIQEGSVTASDIETFIELTIAR